MPQKDGVIMLSLKFAKAALAATPGTTLAALFTQILAAIETAAFSAVVTYLPTLEALALQYAEAAASGSPALAAIMAEIEVVLAMLNPAVPVTP
jgi:hypothetical protein